MSILPAGSDHVDVRRRQLRYPRQGPARHLIRPQDLSHDGALGADARLRDPPKVNPEFPPPTRLAPPRRQPPDTGPAQSPPRELHAILAPPNRWAAWRPQPLARATRRLRYTCSCHRTPLTDGCCNDRLNPPNTRVRSTKRVSWRMAASSA